MSAPVAVAVVSWNTRELLERCLRSLEPDHRDGIAEVWVVDNGSEDGSAELVEREFGWVRLVRAEENLGFGRAVNLVARESDSDWIAPANADVAVEPGALRALVEAGERLPEAGAVAPRLVLPGGETQHSVHPFPTLPFTLLFNLGLHRLSRRAANRLCLEGFWDAERPREVDWAVGAFLLVRRDAFEAVGGFDERLWLYAEDVDLGWRLARAGYTTHYEPAARVNHEQGAAAVQAFGADQTRAWMEATYAWLALRRGRTIAILTGLLNVAGAAVRLDRRWLRAHVRGLATLRRDQSPQVVQAGELRSARIESLRALAALGVLVGHAFGSAHGYRQAELHDTFVHRALLGGGFGVFLFFALSGYLLYLPFARQHLGGGDRVDLAGYARNRALRILPLYYVVIVVVLLVQENGGSWGQWWRFLLFAENFSLDTVGQVNGVLWSLVVELHFYVLLPLLALAVARIGRGTRLGAGLVLAALAAASLVAHFTKVQGSDDPNSPLWRYSILATFFFFVAGMLVALTRIAWEERRPPWLRGPLGSANVWILGSLPLWLLVFDDYSRGPLIAVASMLILGAAVLPLEQGRLVRSLSWRPLALVGVASYSLYLWHVPLLDLITDIVGVPGGFPGLLAIATPVALAIVFASYALIEAPFLRLRRRWARSTAPKVSDGGRGAPRAEPTSPLAP